MPRRVHQRSRFAFPHPHTSTPEQPPGERCRSGQLIVHAALLGALAATGQAAVAADMLWNGTSLLTNQWTSAARWGGAVPGMNDRAVFSNAVAGASNNWIVLETNALPIGLGALQINATSTVARLAYNETHRQVWLYGIGGVGARNEAAHMVRFFKFTRLMGSLSIEAVNAAGGGFDFLTGVTPTGMPHVGIDLNGHTLTLHTLNAANTMTFNAGIGITGTGDVIKTGAGLVSMAGNASVNNFTGATHIQGGRLALLGGGSIAASRVVDVAAPAVFDISGTTAGANIRNLSGSGSVLLGTRTLSLTAASGRFDGVISGTGGLRVASADRFVLGGLNTYGGATQVLAGTLAAGAANAFSATSAHTVAAGATLDLAGFDQQLAALTNEGTVSLVGARAGTTLRVNGAYASNGGTVRLGAGANAAGAVVSDRLVLDGAPATPTGHTAIEVVALPGLGMPTTGDGIEVVSAINGATSTAQTTRDAFSLVGGKVDAGAFEYRLYAADAAGAGEGWYLRTAASAGGQPAYRPEVALIAAAPLQLRQADQSMLGDLRLREGSAGVAGQRHAWARLISTDRINSQAGEVTPDSEGRLNGLQAGTHLWANPRWSLGVYVGQLEGDAGVRGAAGGVHGPVGSNHLRSQYLGGYATYRRDNGFYVDSVLQTARHRTWLQPDAGTASRLKGEGWMPRWRSAARSRWARTGCWSRRCSSCTSAWTSTPPRCPATPPWPTTTATAGSCGWARASKASSAPARASSDRTAASTCTAAAPAPIALPTAPAAAAPPPSAHALVAPARSWPWAPRWPCRGRRACSASWASSGPPVARRAARAASAAAWGLSSAGECVRPHPVHHRHRHLRHRLGPGGHRGRAVARRGPRGHAPAPVSQRGRGVAGR